MFCTECGTKLDDDALFCVNCGTKMTPAADPVAEAVVPAAEPAVEEAVPVATPVEEEAIPVATPVEEEAIPVATPVVEEAIPVATPVAETAGQSIYSETTSNASMYSQPTSGASMYSETTSNVSMYSQPTSGTSMYSQPSSSAATAGVNYGASQGANYGAPQNNTYGATPNNASYNYNAIPTEQPKKKKGKGCLIAVIIALVLGLLALLLVIIAVVAFVLLAGGKTETEYSYEYSEGPSYSFEISEEPSYSFEVSEEPSISFETGTTSEPESQVAVSDTTYEVEDITGYWSGTSTLVSVTGASEMQKYLEDLYGRSLTAEEVAALSTPTNSADMFEMVIYDYYDGVTSDNPGGTERTYPGSWELDLYMGDLFGFKTWDDWDAMTYDEFQSSNRGYGCIKLDDEGKFMVDVVEQDYLGEYGGYCFDIAGFDVSESDVKDDGVYGFEFSGQVVEGYYGPEIVGEIVVMFQYGDMSEPYGMAYQYELDYFEKE